MSLVVDWIHRSILTVGLSLTSTLSVDQVFAQFSLDQITPKFLSILWFNLTPVSLLIKCLLLHHICLEGPKSVMHLLLLYVYLCLPGGSKFCFCACYCTTSACVCLEGPNLFLCLLMHHDYLCLPEGSQSVFVVTNAPRLSVSA